MEQADRTRQADEHFLPAIERAARFGRAGERGEKRGLDPVEGGNRSVAAQGLELARTPALNAPGEFVRRFKSQRLELGGEAFAARRERQSTGCGVPRLHCHQRIISRPDGIGDRRKFAHQGLAVRQAIELRHPI